MCSHEIWKEEERQRHPSPTSCQFGYCVHPVPNPVGTAESVPRPQGCCKQVQWQWGPASWSQSCSWGHQFWWFLWSLPFLREDHFRGWFLGHCWSWPRVSISGLLTDPKYPIPASSPFPLKRSGTKPDYHEYHVPSWCPSSPPTG